MTNQSEDRKRSRGRPVTPETELRAALEQATLTLLLDGGYAAATVDAVARRAGVAKKTLYRFAANRDELMTQVVTQVVSRWTGTFQSAFSHDAERRETVPILLENGLNAVAQQVLSPEAVGIFRLLQSEFPDRGALLTAYQRNGIQRGRAIVAEWLQRQQQHGLLLAQDWAQTSDLLLAMVIAEPLRQMALGLLQPGSDIGKRIAAAVMLVLPGLLKD